MLIDRLLLATSFSLLISCSNGSGSQDPDTSSNEKPLSVTFLLARGGKGDKSYNDTSLKPVEDVENKLKDRVKFQIITPANPDEFSSILDRVIERNPDLIIGVGFQYTRSFDRAAKSNPEQKFLLLDGQAESQNIQSIVFDEDEGSFLAGVVAASETTTNTVGFIGGMNIPIINSFECGYAKGVEWIEGRSDAQISIKSVYIGNTPDAFANPSRGRNLARSIVKDGVDVIYHAAGASGTGIIDAAEDENVKAIGVDTDQNYLAKNTVISSMLKRMDRAVSNAIMQVETKTFEGGTVEYNVENGGVSMLTPGLLSSETQQNIDYAITALTTGEAQACPPDAK